MLSALHVPHNIVPLELSGQTDSQSLLFSLEIAAAQSLLHKTYFSSHFFTLASSEVRKAPESCENQSIYNLDAYIIFHVHHSLFILVLFTVVLNANDYNSI